MAKAPAAAPKLPVAAAFSERGTTGLQQYGGFVYQEFQRELYGQRGQRAYREMSDNDPMCGAILNGIDLLLRRAEWRVEPANDTAAASDAADFVKSLMEDMNRPWDDFVADANTMLIYGWSFVETVFKRRVGPDEADGSKRSRYSDGLIGIRKLAPRAQDTLYEWQIQPDGSIDGWWQLPVTGGEKVFLPLDKGLLFRTTARLDNPEGRSILRNAWRPWYMKKVAEDMEAVGIERELAGIPLVRIPASILELDDANPVKQSYLQVARDLKFNQQGGLVMPSDVWRDPENKPTSNYLYSIELVQGAGPRSINTNETIIRYDQQIARSVLADFMTLGTSSKGSHALSEDKSGLFIRAVETYGWQIAAPLNRYLIPQVWAFNAMDPELIPTITPGALSPIDLMEQAELVKALAAAGMPLFPDEGLENQIRENAGWPARSAETLAAMNVDQAEPEATDDEEAEE